MMQSVAAAAPKASVAPRGAKQLAAVDGFHTPDWVKDAVFYQIFPDRFRNGDTANDPAGTAPWGSPPQNDNFFEGGDLQGVTQKLDYLKQLGVNSLYLNPIFSSPSNHKYNTTDYTQVDPGFGGTATFDKLVDAAHAGGIKLVLDGVFNHTSNEHVWFKDVIEKGPKSPYWSWYNVNRWPITTWKDDKGVLRTNDYESWGKPEWGGPFATLPVLQYSNPQVRDALMTGRDSILRSWVRDHHIDGWRMDAADEIEPENWQQARAVLKQENPDAYLLGENWHDASGMLRGDQFDGVTNYRYFQQPAVDFFAHKSTTPDQFVRQLANPYPREAKLAMLNILESHDTPRFITQAGGDWYRMRPAAIFQMTYQGAPSIFYGGELGQEGGTDPANRGAFDWNAADRVAHAHDPNAPVLGHGTDDKSGALFSLYQRLIDTRSSVAALRRGDFQVLQTHNDDGTLTYRRYIDGDAKDAVVALNNSATQRDITVPMTGVAADGTAYTDALSGAKFLVRDGQLSLRGIDGNWGAVLVRAT